MEVHSLSLASATILLILVSISTLASNSIIRPESRDTGGKFPYQVMMLIPENYNQLCGGYVLSSTYILIAAHCVVNIVPKKLRILDSRDKVKPYHLDPSVTVEDMIIHPFYDQQNSNPLAGSMLFNNIAILKLTDHLILGGARQTIAIDEQNLAKDGILVKSVDYVWTGSLSTSYIMKKGYLVVTTTECKQNHLPDLVTEAQICTFNATDYMCNEEVGAPLLCDEGNGVDVLCGISSVSYGDHRMGCFFAPVVFTRVYHYREWIKDVLSGEENSESGCIGSRFVPPTSTSPSPTDRQGQLKSNSCCPRVQILSYGIYMSFIFLSYWGKNFV